MAAKILIIDNDESTLQLFIQVAGALNLDYQIIHNWIRTTAIEDKDNVQVIFVNVEFKSLDLQLLLRQFQKQSHDEKQVSVFYLFSKSFNRSYLAAKRFPHAGELKKPIKAEELFDALNSCLDLEKQINYPEENYRQKIQQFHAYYSVTKELINKLEAYFD